MLEIYSESNPSPIDKVKYLYQRLRDIKARFKERMELDHNFAGVVDTALVECDGYHKRLTMPAYSGINQCGETISTPEDIAGSGKLYVRIVSGSAGLYFKSNGIEVKL